MKPNPHATSSAGTETMSETPVLDRDALGRVAKRTQELLDKVGPPPAAPDFSVERGSSGIPATAFHGAVNRYFVAMLNQAAATMLSLEPMVIAATRLQDYFGIRPEKLEQALRSTELIQKQIASMYGQITDYLELAPEPDDEVLRMGRIVKDAANRLYDEFERQRWAALEAEADRDIAEGRVKKFGHAEAAIAYLNKKTR